jgi:hypothetical protein
MHLKVVHEEDIVAPLLPDCFKYISQDLYCLMQINFDDVLNLNHKGLTFMDPPNFHFRNQEEKKMFPTFNSEALFFFTPPLISMWQFFSS